MHFAFMLGELPESASVVQESPSSGASAALGASLFTQSIAVDGHRFTTRDSTYGGDPLRLGRIQTYGVEGESRLFLGPNAYFGYMLGLGVGRAQSDTTFEADGHRYDASSGGGVLSFRTGALLGAALPLQRLRVRFESLVGLQMISLSHDVASTSGGATERTSSLNATFLLEPRVALDLWVGPRVTVSAYVGKDLLHLRDTTAGIGFSLHALRFDRGA
jgi:hypothetical protein